MNVDHLLNQLCTIAAAGSQDRYGKLGYDAPITEACRFMETTRTITTPQKERTPIDGIVTLKANTTATSTSKVIFKGVTYRVMRIDPAVDGSGITRHLRIMVQKWDQ